jgi:hypothetical protein
MLFRLFKLRVNGDKCGSVRSLIHRITSQELRNCGISGYHSNELLLNMFEINRRHMWIEFGQMPYGLHGYLNFKTRICKPLVDIPGGLHQVPTSF